MIIDVLLAIYTSYPQAGEPKQNDKFATRKYLNEMPTHILHIYFFAIAQTQP